MINEDYIIKIRTYIQSKTGKLYFKNIKSVNDNLLVTCPFHKEGQENKPSASIRITYSEKVPIGLFRCFTCGETMMLPQVIKNILGDLYNDDEIESLFGFNELNIQDILFKDKQTVHFDIPEELTYETNVLKQYDYYHEYLLKRGINEDTAKKYNIGYDSFSRQITFPIRDINRFCLGIGRRSVDKKQYLYPYNMKKPLYGVYELPRKVNFLWIVEGPFNLWSLAQWGKSAIALLGTGTEYQYKLLSKFKCTGYILCLDPDLAGRKGMKKIIKYLLKHNRTNIYVALMPEGKDVNDLTNDEFKEVEVVEYSQFLKLFSKI